MNAIAKALIQTLATMKGQNIRVTWSRKAKTLKAYEGETIEKTTSAIVRTGIDYDNMASVKEKRENGELPAQNAGLPWGTWAKDLFHLNVNKDGSLFPFAIEHKGNYYLRLYPASGVSFGGKTIETVWKHNGKEVSKESIAYMLQASEKSNEEMPDCFTIKEESIISSSALNA